MSDTVNENNNIINRKVVLTRSGVNQRGLAKALGYTPAAIQNAISGGGTSYRIHRRIADYLGVSMVSFWPELYDNMSAQPAQSSDAPVAASM